MKEITDINGNKIQVNCIGCAIQEGKLQRPNGAVLLTEHFDAHQDVEVPIPGFVILASRRHLLGIDQFTEEESADFIKTLRKVRKAMREALGIETVYLVQEEDTSDHFHIWIFPRYDWMVEKFGRKIQSLRPIMEFAREHLKTPENMDKVNDAITNLQKALS